MNARWTTCAVVLAMTAVSGCRHTAAKEAPRLLRAATPEAPYDVLELPASLAAQAQALTANQPRTCGGHSPSSEAVIAPQVGLQTREDLDPSSLGFGGGYWFLVPTGNGRAAELLYSGVTRQSPYAFHVSMEYPRVEGDSVWVVATREELDRSKRWMPPLSPPLKRDPKAVLLRFRLEDLNRDTDHDGLTDLAESRLLTRTDDPDSDQDGRPDSTDVNPLVPLAVGHRSRLDLLRSTVLEKELSRTVRLVLMRSEEPFDVPRAPFKMLTLSEAELKAYFDRFGERATYGLRIAGCGASPCEWLNWRASPRHPFHEDDAFAAVEFSAPFSGTSYDAHWTGERWELTERYGFMARWTPVRQGATVERLLRHERRPRLVAE